MLTETGRDRLKEVTPKTYMKARIELAQRIGRKAERNRLQGDAVSLYYLGPTVESQIDAELDGVNNDGTAFEALDGLTTTFDEPSWTLTRNERLHYKEADTVLCLLIVT